ncbi:MAG: hypothetical protein JKY54_16700, partial [Flavobacteriales bacterium]|nr:hypothetical protein [Flavobacteriales bacterium]
MKASLIILFLLITLVGSAQNKREFSDLFSGFIDYRIPVNKSKINSSNKGVNVEFSFDFSRLFSETGWLSLYAGWGWTDKLWLTEFKEDFANDFDESNSFGSFSGLDSSGLSRLQSDFHWLKQRDVPLPSYHSGFHETNLYYGISITPKNVSLPVLKIYKGNTKTIGGIDRVCVDGGEFGFHIIRRPLNIGVNLCQRDIIHLFSKKKNGLLS